MSNSKSAQISALVAQLKAGLINKQELFESLNRLQHGDVPTEPKPNVRFMRFHTTLTQLFID